MTTGLRILLVEDDLDTRDLMRTAFELAGDKVYEATNALVALETVARVDPDVIVTDIILAGDVDGYELARRLRAIDVGKRALLVAFTGMGRAEDRDEAGRAGFDAHILKPMDPFAFAEQVRQLRR